MMSIDFDKTVIETTLTANNDSVNLIRAVNDIYLDIAKLGDGLLSNDSLNDQQDKVNSNFQYKCLTNI